MQRTHFGQHDSCFACKLRSLQYAGKPPSPQSAFEKRQERDLPAYQRLRSHGLQPPSTRNCAELEQRAESQIEVQMGKLIDPKLLRQNQNQIAEGMWMAKEIGATPETMREWKDKAAEKQ